ncbi:hypothetical protein [Metabacillus litoralis]|uniref:hypothetical protein n=1 Tax=Metabacillus litoralis TaxID=152268 RepID=UPI001CFD5605|nr:hypothetical protein [Metabacillus litoralis]
MIKIRMFFIILVISFPFLASFETYQSNHRSLALYQSPEGILFKSYSSMWDQKKLIDLYHKLLQNKHGEELKLLRVVEIKGTTLDGSLSKGSYDPLNKTITLYQGNKYTNPSNYQETLSHEYGHHFAYYYFPSHHFPLSKWQKMRGLDLVELRWDAFWNYQNKYHANYPQEIFADDYVLLYGATRQVDTEDIETNEAFYLRTEHENQQIPNVLENSELHYLLEKKTGIEIDKSRLLHLPKFNDYKNEILSFHITAKKDIAYRLNLSLKDSSGLINKHESYRIHINEPQSLLTFDLNKITNENLSKYDLISASIDVVDLNTSIGMQTQEWFIKPEDI